MGQGRVAAICICPVAGGRMQLVKEAEAVKGRGLMGDRYAAGIGSFNQGAIGKRQITLVNGIFLVGSGFGYADSRRNIVTFGTELMWLIGREFRIGEYVRIGGVKYCDPCDRPSRLKGRGDFRKEFYDCGGLIAEILEGGIIKVGDPIITPEKGY